MDDGILRSKYEESELRCIGKGGFGKVFLAKSKKGKETLAVKVIETNSLETFQKALDELKIMQKINEHENIVNFMSYDLNQLRNPEILFQIIIEMPLADGSLETYLKKNPILKEEKIFEICKQLFTGLKYAHDNKMAHMDLKPENVLIFSGVCKIADWGGSLQLRSSKSTSVRSEVAGTWGYSAPELENYGDESKYNFYLCDVYSLAMVILRTCGFTNERLRKIPKGQKRYHDLDFKEEILPVLTKQGYSERLTTLLKKMSTFDPVERISLEGAIDYLEKSKK